MHSWMSRVRRDLSGSANAGIFLHYQYPPPPTFRPCSLKCSSSQHPWHDAFMLRVLEFPNELRSVWSTVSTQLIKDMECALFMGELSKAGLAEHKCELNTPHLPSTHARLKCSLIQHPLRDAFALRRILESLNESRSVWSAVSTQLIKYMECVLLMGEPSKAGLAERKRELNTPHLPSTHTHLKCSLIQCLLCDAFTLRRVLESPNESRSMWSNWI